MAALLYSLHLDWSALFKGDLGAGTAALRDAAQRQGPMEGVVMTIMIAVLPFAMVPITVVLLTAAMILPPLPAVAAIMLGSGLNTVLSYGIGRIWGREAIRWMGLERFKLMQVLRDGAREHGLKMAVISRYMPVPFCLPGLAAAVLGIGFWEMLLGSLMMMLPWAVLYVFFSESLRRGDFRYLAPVLGIFAILIAATWWLRRKGTLNDGMPEGLLQPQSPALGPELTLYTLPDQEACDDARRELWKLRSRFNFEVREIDLSQDPKLLAQYQDLAPLVFLGERRLFSFQVDENALEIYLKAKRD